MEKIDIEASANPCNHPPPILRQAGANWAGTFEAMASPCEVLLSGVDVEQARVLVAAVCREAWRIEYKYSRYLQGNETWRLNHSNGTRLEVDEETAALLEYAKLCYRLSEGLFDITSGVLRQVWKFDGSDRLPSPQDILNMLPLVGWDKVSWDGKLFGLPQGMELDFGGVGKEYAVDKCLLKALEMIPEGAACLVNFGGDLACSGPQQDGTSWRVGVERAGAASTGLLELRQGALATSGDSRRYLLKDQIRYSHILNPKTGWPVTDAPHSVTVAAPRCTEAGMLASFASLQGKDAEAFLEARNCQFWVQR